MLGPQPLRKQQFRDEAQLEVVARKLVHGLEHLGQGGQQVPVVGVICRARSQGQVRAELAWGVQDPDKFPSFALLGPQSRVPVLAVLVWLPAYWEDASEEGMISAPHDSRFLGSV